MWTPKRIVMLVGGFALFFVAYAAYSTTYFGAIDSLPPLPEAYKPPTKVGPPPVYRPPTETRIDKKLKEAFGLGCPEIKWPIKLDLNAKSMVICSESCEFEAGRLKLVPISVALFGKDKGDGKGIEINTVRANSAYLTFDRPVNSPNEVNGRKIVEMELIRNIEIVNNRRTPSRDDDLTVNIQTGPLYYNEPRHFVWTKDVIHLVDRQSKPDPLDVCGKGMEMELLTQAAPVAKPGTAPPAKNKSENITGVKRIVLLSDVIMHLYSAPGAGVMGTPKKAEQPKAAKAPAAPADQGPKEHIVVQTQGRFQYDFLKDYDLATFDVPIGEAGAHLPQDVTVTRYHVAQGGTDELVCQHLELRLKHRDNSAQAGKQGAEADQGGGLEVETAHATAGAREVVLKSDPERVIARGNDFFYDAFKKQSILKGDPEIEVERDGSVLHARQMDTQEMKPPAGSPPGTEGYQQVIALGPGSIHMGERGSDKKTTHAYWNERLTSTRDGQHDLLILTGAARFVDDEHEQSLQAEVLKVWLLSEDKSKKAARAAAAPPMSQPGAQPGTTASPALGGEQGRKPHHLEATGSVVARSRELNIHDTERLVTWFKDVDVLPAAPRQGPGAAPRKDPPAAAPVTVPLPQGAWGQPRAPSGVVPASYVVQGPAPTPAAPMLGAPVPPAGPPGAPASPPPPPRPIDLSARQVEAWVLRCGDKNQLDKMYSEGNVHVRQEPAKPDENPVDVRGDQLQMKSHPEGNELVVNGDLAQLQMDKIYIIGPEVNIDQATNRAWVHGVGAMKMESATNFQGAKLEKTVPLTVHWNSEMFFNGEYAEFLGGIQAEQENARLASEALQVYFDRPVSLKEGSRGDQPAKVRNLLADKNVRVEDTAYERTGELLKYQQIRGTLLQMFTLTPDEASPRGADGKPKECNQVTVSGPGDVRILQRGSNDPTISPGRTTEKPGGPVVGTPVSVARGAGPERRPGNKADEPMKMTYVTFLHRMDANSKTSTAKFWGSVRVLNFPCDNPHEEIDIDAIIGRELPPGVMYLRADYLEVLDQPENGKSNQQMRARDRVRVQGREYLGEANEVTFDESKDLVVFIGTRQNPATLAKQVQKGQKWQTIQGEKILYKRSTGDARVEGGSSINN